MSAVAEEETLQDQHERENDDCRVLRPEDDRDERAADEVTARARCHGDIEGPEREDIGREDGQERKLLVVHLASKSSECKRDEDQGDRSVDRRLSDGSE